MKLGIKQFHTELKAALAAGVPIEIDGGDRFGQLTFAKLDQLENSLKQDAGENETLTQTADSHPELPYQYRAALRTFDQTGSMLPVLEGLTVQNIARQQVSKILRWSFVYLFVLLLAAFLGLMLFDFRVVPAIDGMRADMLLPAAINAPERFDVTPWLPTIVTVLGCGLIVLLIWILLGGTTKTAMWLGGRRFVQCRTSTTALRIIQLLMAAGMDVEDAVKISCDLIDADPKVRRDIQVAVQDPDHATGLGTLADYLTISANHRLAYMKVATPIGLVCTVGGTIALVYCLTIFWPIISMLRDLSTAGT